MALICIVFAQGIWLGADAAANPNEDVA